MEENAQTSRREPRTTHSQVDQGHGWPRLPGGHRLRVHPDVLWRFRWPISDRGSLRFDGCVTLLATAILIAGVVLKYTLSEKLLQRHPAGRDSVLAASFRFPGPATSPGAAVVSDALVRGRPCSIPSRAGPRTTRGGSASSSSWALAFAVLTWFNRVAAIRLEHEARSLGRLGPHKPRLWLRSKKQGNIASTTPAARLR